MQTIYRIEGRVQHYSWGGYQFIPSLLQIPNEDKQPCAEYWLGAHPAFPSKLSGQEQSLATLIQSEGEKVLGRAGKKFASLPFLFKVLDVRQMLSIQVHPSKEEAVKGYRAEEEAGIPLGAPHRNYKDENHKPEAMVAISDFWLLHGFKPAEPLQALLASVPELSFLSDVFQSGGYQALYALVMNLPQSNINVLLHPLADRILPLYDDDQLEKDSEHFWAARAIRTFCKDGNLDRGIFSVYLFNLVHLRPGEGIYQPAGMPHAYLEGQNIEIMANSDNVLRGGLTDKHVDVDELMKHTAFDATVPNILLPGARGIFTTPAEEFCLSMHTGQQEVVAESDSAQLVFVLKGAVSIAGGGEKAGLHTGQAALLSPRISFHIQPEGAAEFYKVSIPAT